MLLSRLAASSLSPFGHHGQVDVCRQVRNLPDGFSFRTSEGCTTLRLEDCKLWAGGSGIITGSAAGSEPACELYILDFIALVPIVVSSALSKASFVLERDVFCFVVLPLDAVASSALIVTTLWTKVAPRTNFSFFFFFFLLLALDVPQSDPEGHFVMKS